MSTKQNTTKNQSTQNTPWQGWKPGEARAAFEQAFVNGNNPVVAQWATSTERSDKERAEIVRDIALSCAAAAGDKPKCPNCHSINVQVWPDGFKRCRHCGETWA